MKLHFLSIVISTITIFPSAAAIIGVDHIHESASGFDVDQEFEASFPPERAVTGFGFTSTGPFSFEYRGTALDEGVSIFLVEADDAFSEATILMGNFSELTAESNYTFQPNFFLGIRTPALGIDRGTFEPAYGWVEVQNLGTGDLVLVDHAIAYDAQGIIVDTLTAIPEPSQVALFGTGLFFALGCRRRNK